MAESNELQYQRPDGHPLPIPPRELENPFSDNNNLDLADIISDQTQDMDPDLADGPRAG
jgi:hypothetical protein